MSFRLEVRGKTMMKKERINYFDGQSNEAAAYLIYWMQRAHRISDNLALNFAIEKANSTNLPLIVYFELMIDYPEARSQHFQFMLEGLLEIEEKLKKRGIKFHAFQTKAANRLQPLIQLSAKASCIITDSGYLKIHRNLRRNLLQKVKVPAYIIETESIIPVQVASPKEEYAAYTLRKKIKSKLKQYLRKVDRPTLKNHSNPETPGDIDLKQKLENIRSASNNSNLEIKGGYKEAKVKLKDFIARKLDLYDNDRSDPNKSITSELSPYLHFGHISANEIINQLPNKDNNNIKAFIEELFIRRELSFNFVWYNESYDSLDCLPNWAYQTLKEHSTDKREFVYSLSTFEKAETHDSAWNAAQKELLFTGKMHGYMRMYWGKKILEWTQNPEEAFEICLYLNNKYALDGRDPNSYAGVAWCFGKHDRPWKERKIFGKVRYMNRNGLKRKFNLKEYIASHKY